MPLEKKDFRSTLGALKGKIWISDDFDDPLPPEMLKAFGISIGCSSPRRSVKA